MPPPNSGCVRSPPPSGPASTWGDDPRQMSRATPRPWRRSSKSLKPSRCSISPATTGCRELLAVRAGFKGSLAKFEKEVEAIDTEIKDKLGPAETALLPGWKISWKTQAREAYTVPAGTRRPLLVSAVEAKEQAA